MSVAKHSGVSVSTVSRALSNDTRIAVTTDARKLRVYRIEAP